jgi:hypothetical protein
MRKTLYLVLTVMCLSLSSCGHTTGGVAPSTEPLAPGSYKELGWVHGQDCANFLLSLIPLGNGNETKDAVADAMTKAPGASALVKVSADTYSNNFIVFSRVCTQVQGVAVAPR